MCPASVFWVCRRTAGVSRLVEPYQLAYAGRSPVPAKNSPSSFDSTMLAGYDDGMEGTGEARSLGFPTYGG
jgi:hypothetical protein